MSGIVAPSRPASWYLCAFFALVAAVSTLRADAQQTIRFTNGNWFNGSGFVKTDFYSVDGLLTHQRPNHIDQAVDLHGLYVVPAYGDAHEHNFDSLARTPAVAQQYLKDGIFYAQGMTESIPGSHAVVQAGLVNAPTTVDVTYAHAGLTGVNGHPKDTYEGILFGIY